MEEVYTRSSKVMIDSKSSGNLLYLPIDKLAEQSADQTQTKRESKSGAAYDHIQLESQKQNTQQNNSSTRSTSSRQGRY
jgi:membrane protease subunit HflK